MVATYLRLIRVAIVASLLLPPLALICNRLIGGDEGFSSAVLVGLAVTVLAAGVALYGITKRSRAVLVGVLVAGCIFPIAALHLAETSTLFSPEWLLVTYACVSIGWIAIRLMSRCGGAIESMARTQASFLDALNEKWVEPAIFAAAGLGLFVELALIRWQTTLFEFFAFYKNIGLLSCFAGLGLGYALASRRGIPLAATGPLLAWQVAIAIFLRHGFPEGLVTRVMVSPVTEQSNIGFGIASSVPHFVAVYMLIGVVFLLSALALIPLGQLAGRLMQRRANLRAYGLNLAGSIAGTGLMLGASFLWTPPAVWFALGWAGLLAFQAYAARPLAVAGFGLIFMMILLAWPVSTTIEQIYSPYQLIERMQGTNGLMKIKAGGLYHQKVYNFSATASPDLADRETRKAFIHYNLPFKIFGRPESVAVVGAGTGNDVAAALRAGASRIDAIEIDPAIFMLGKVYHPEQPYDDVRVRAILADARTFLRTTDTRYDMIVYGLLDSHALLGNSSSVRLDSFVYTVEGLREARARLKDGGVLALSFSVGTRELGAKMYRMITEAFDGRAPVCIRVGYDYSILFLQAEGRDLSYLIGETNADGLADVTSLYADPTIDVDVSTDDWPFFYMPKRRYPLSYLGLGGVLLALSSVLILSFGRSSLDFNRASFFFLGAGFMLVETKAITELGLAFGNTWQVIGIVIVGILTMAFLANCVVAWLKIENHAPPMVMLLISLGVGYLVAGNGGFTPTLGGKLATLALLTCPVFFSGIVFSTLLRSSRGVAGVMAVNILGAMCGGLLEYNSMFFGFRFLYVLAAGLYATAWLSHAVRRSRAGGGG